MKRTAKGPASRLLATPHILWSVLFIIIPLAFVAFYAFTETTEQNGIRFTFEHIQLFFTPKYLNVFLRSVKLASIATLICLLVGYPAAYFISRTSASTQKILVVLIMLPMWTNFIIRTYALSEVLEVLNNAVVFLLSLLPESLVPIPLDPKPDILIYNEFAVIVGMVYDFLPYMILPIYSVMAKLDYRLVEAAQDLGCNGFAVLRKVIMPLSIPGVLSGFTMVFVPSISTFYISNQLGGIFLIGDIIDYYYYNNNHHFAAALSFVLMLILLAGLILMNRFGDTDKEGSR
ncbi:MAG: ABC transporter permease [Clostridia bacterium]|nr:ABC transporter permease [Clostridia bacterium]